MLSHETIEILKTLQALLPNITDFSRLGDDQLQILHEYLSLAAAGIEDMENDLDFGLDELS